MKTIALIAHHTDITIRFRGPLIRDLIQAGWNVQVLIPNPAPADKNRIHAIGATPVEYRLSKTGMNPIKDILTLTDLYRKLKDIQPDAVFTYHAKLNVYGILAARFTDVPVRLALFPGLGYAFTRGFSVKKFILKRILLTLYRVSLPSATRVFFQNSDDYRYLTRITGLEKAVILGATGVDPEEWKPLPPYTQPVTFTLIARLIKEKGIREFVKAAELVKSHCPEARFFLIGPVYPDFPGAITHEELKAWEQKGLIQWVPWTDDVQSYLRITSVYVLPSWYREGVPRSTQEAMATARPVITTDVPGCRETVEYGRNGFIVPAKDHRALAHAMMEFITNPRLIEEMGIESRKIAEERFNVRNINSRFIAFLNDEIKKYNYRLRQYFSDVLGQYAGGQHA